MVSHSVGLIKRTFIHRVDNKTQKYGFKFYKAGKGSHELWARHSDRKVIPVPHHKGKAIRKGTIRAIIREIDIPIKEFFS